MTSPPKTLEVESTYDKLDLDNDGVVSDSEIAALEAVEKAEKQHTQRRMAWATLIAMGAFTLAMFFVDIPRVKALADVSNLFFLSGAGIVGAYMSVSMWMTAKK
jgi:hypothetical protein